MKIPILYELNQELTRLFVAGSRLSTDDPRLKKYIAPLSKLGEKAPVFQKLAVNVQELLSAAPEQSAGKLIDTQSFLLSILSTQGENAPAEPPIEIDPDGKNYGLDPTVTRYSALKPVIDVLTRGGSGSVKVMKDAFEHGVLKDPRCYAAISTALGRNDWVLNFMFNNSDNTSQTIAAISTALGRNNGVMYFMCNNTVRDMFDYSSQAIADNTSQTIHDNVFSYIGERIIPFLLDDFNIEGDAGDGRRLMAMYLAGGETVLPIAEAGFEKGSDPVKIDAIKIMSDYPKYEKLLLNSLGERKAVREEAMRALIKLNSKEGIDKVLAIYNGDKPGNTAEIITQGNSPYLVQNVLDLAQNAYAAVQVERINPEDVKNLYKATGLLRNKPAEEVAAFFKRILSEDWLEKAEKALPKAEKQGYHYSLAEISLETLFLTRKEDDFIWAMFKETQQGFFSKVFKKKANAPHDNLARFAFRIGAWKLDPEDFYDTFFKTDLYKEIVKIEPRIFDNTFLRGDKENPGYSRRIAGYFIRNGNFHAAKATVFPDDGPTLAALKAYFKE